MRIKIFVILWIVWSGQLFGQNNFEYIYTDSISYFRASGAVELANGNYVVSSVQHNEPQETWDVWVFLLDWKGSLLELTTLQYPGYQLISTGVFIESDTSFMLTALANGTDESVLWVSHISNSLDKMSEKLFEYDLPKILLMNGRKESDSTLIFTGYVEGYRPYAAKLNFVSDTLNILGYGSNLDFCYDVLPRKDSVGYLILGSSNLILTDSVFEITRIVDKPLGDWNGNLIDGFKDSSYIYTSKLPYGDTVAIVVSEISSDDFSILKNDLLADTFSYINGAQVKVYAAPRKSLAQSSDVIYVGGVSFVDFPIWKPSKLILGKFDSELNKLWEKEYGNDTMFYFMNGVLATSDGGCLMYGYRVKYSQSDLKEAYVLKVDENGIITGETSIPLKDEIGCYPNPAKDYIQFDLPKSTNMVSLELIDLSGRVVLAQKINHQAPIDISFLPQGMYMYQVKGQNGALIGVGKVLKE